MSLPKPQGLEILHDDGLSLVLNKQGGLLTQGPPDVDSVEFRLKQWFRQQNPEAKKIYCGVPHRLDRPVSGAMVFCRNPEGTRHISGQFQHRSVEKVYWAVVKGEVNPVSGTWTDFMRKLPDQAKSETCNEQHPDAQLARLKYQVLTQNQDLSWLKIRLETGRTHQIRVQASSRGWPILGDQLYDSTVPFGPELADLRTRWIALHARSLTFDHPTLNKRLTIEAPLYEAWRPLADQIDAGCPEVQHAVQEAILPPSTTL